MTQKLTRRSLLQLAAVSPVAVTLKEAPGWEVASWRGVPFSLSKKLKEHADLIPAHFRMPPGYTEVVFEEDAS